MTNLNHTRRRNRRALWALLPFVALLSCQKNILNSVPQTSISSANAFSTPAKILAQVNALYSQLENGYYYGGSYLIYNEQRGDEFSQNDANSAVGSLVWEQDVLATSAQANDLWSAAYQAINSANIFISNVTGTTLISDTLANQYLGEARFVRALSYLSLVQTFGRRPFTADQGASLGLPLRLDPVTSQTDNNLARSTVAEIYTQILQDLTFAEANLPSAGYSTALLNISRATVSAAVALKLRVYLTQGDYTDAVTEAAKIVPAAAPYKYTAGTVTHQLEANIATVFGGSYTGAEAVFYLPFINATEAPANQEALAYYYYGEPVLYLNTQGIVSNPAYASGSADARASLVVTSSGRQLLKKFSKNTAPYSDYIPVVRYAEVLLNYAEAAARTNDAVTATALLNAVRHRSNPNYTFPASSIGTQDSLINTILTERRIELLGEGFRTPDLQRTLQTLPAKSGAIGTAPAVDPTDINYVWPIPTSEISYNTACVQNLSTN